MVNIQEINSSIMFGDLNNDQLNSIVMAIKYRRSQLTKENKRMLNLGSQVKFYSSKRGVTVQGTVEKIAQKYVTVREPVRGLWKVPANMIEVV
ncbi:MAG: hypothetical protein RLZZ196_1028 [Bacteroidota bacterium]|jgi:hypothetical protein